MRKDDRPNVPIQYEGDKENKVHKKEPNTSISPLMVLKYTTSISTLSGWCGSFSGDRVSSYILYCIAFELQGGYSSIYRTG